MSNKKTSQELNQYYFKSFILTRGSVSMLSLAFPGLFVGIIVFIPFYYEAKEFYNINPWSSIPVIVLFTCVMFMVLCCLLYILKAFIYKHQNFSSVMLSGLSIVLTCELIFLCLMIVDLEGTYEGSILAIIFMFLISITYVIALIYNSIWIKKQLKNGFSEDRANKNYLASSIYRSDSLWIIFGCAVAGVAFGRIGEKIFGFAAGLLFVCAFSRLSIEMSYAAYLRIKDNQYWEEMPEKKVLTREERRVARTRCIKIINVFFCFGVLYFMGKLVVKYNLTRGQIFIGRIAIILIFLDLGTVMILWIIKKIRKMWKEKKKRRQ